MTDIPQPVLALVSSALGVEPAKISASTSMTSEPAWDSLAHMRLILAIEEELGRELEPEALVEIGTVADIVRIFD